MKLWVQVAIVLCLAAPAFAQSDELLHERVTQYVTALPVATAPVTAGKSTTVQLRFRVKPAFHINSNTPRSDLLIATSLHLSPPSEISTGRTKYPAGEELAFPFDPRQRLSVYSGEFVVTTKVVASLHAPTGNMTVHGNLHYQACNDNACFPPKDVPVQFDVRVSRAPYTPRATGRGQSPHVKF